MPVETVKYTLRIHRKINRQVLDNIARLWQVGQQAKTYQDILDGLHPWGDHPGLKFNNVLPFILLVIASGFTLFGIFFIQHSLIAGLSFLTAFALGLFAYLCYESDQPLTEVIQFLEQQILEKKYQLNFQELPPHFPDSTQPFFFIARLKNLFPVFQQGSVSNMLPVYASTTWKDQQGRERPIMLFQYDFINEIKIAGQDTQQVAVQRTQKTLWGIFVFEAPALGLAVTTSNKKFGPPYSSAWYSSDLQINQKLRIYGLEPLELAKTMTPAMTLRLDQFFTQHSGELLFHHEHHIMCFLNRQNLFKIHTKAQNREDISSLRGHLRTLRLGAYEKLLNNLEQLLQ